MPFPLALVAALAYPPPAHTWVACRPEPYGKVDYDSEGYSLPELVGGEKGDACVAIKRQEGRSDTYTIQVTKSVYAPWRDVGTLFVHSSRKKSDTHFGGSASLSPARGTHSSSFFVEFGARELSVYRAAPDRSIQGAPPMVALAFWAPEPSAAPATGGIDCKTPHLAVLDRTVCTAVIDPMKARRGEHSVLDCTGPLGDGYEINLCANVERAVQAELHEEHARKAKAKPKSEAKPKAPN